LDVCGSGSGPLLQRIEGIRCHGRAIFGSTNWTQGIPGPTAHPLQLTRTSIGQAVAKHIQTAKDRKESNQ
jgi:hypothetical protein